MSSTSLLFRGRVSEFRRVFKKKLEAGFYCDGVRLTEYRSETDYYAFLVDDLQYKTHVAEYLFIVLFI